MKIAFLLAVVGLLCLFTANYVGGKKSSSGKRKGGKSKGGKKGGKFDISKCGPAEGTGAKVPTKCEPMKDPQNRKPSKIEEWFTEEMFNDLFPYANLGMGPNDCLPYNYKSFIIACRYFPEFGASSPKNGLSYEENTRRDVAVFFGHSIQETGMNIGGVFDRMDKESAKNCYYRGGLYAWFETGMTSGSGNSVKDGESGSNTYCGGGADLYPCKKGAYYYGRGPYQLSYNFNYGQFQEWLVEQNITGVDLLAKPNLVMTKLDPPLVMMASLWFHMTPQPPKPAMHDIILGQWEAGKKNRAKGFSGPIFGPTSLIINGECQGYSEDPRGGLESRRIHAFLFFCKYFGVDPGPKKTWSCADMPEKLNQIPHNVRYKEPSWADKNNKNLKCKCVPAPGVEPGMTYYDRKHYPRFTHMNKQGLTNCLRAMAKAKDYTCKMPSYILKGLKGVKGGKKGKGGGGKKSSKKGKAKPKQ